MYDKRIKTFVILSASFLLVCLLRLSQMQLLPSSSLQDDIAKLKLQRSRSRQLKTIRGKILDRKGKVLAADELRFQLHINYKLSSLLDKRLQRGKLSRAAENRHDAVLAVARVQEQLRAGLEDLQQVIDKCTHFGIESSVIEDRIKNINNEVWNLRTFLAWMRNSPDTNILEKYNNRVYKSNH